MKFISLKTDRSTLSIAADYLTFYDQFHRTSIVQQRRPGNRQFEIAANFENIITPKCNSTAAYIAGSATSSRSD
jgi:hypothetical protein